MKPAVLGCGRRYFGGLEQHLPGTFVRHVVELPECLVFNQDELPQIDRPPLAGQDPANEHDLDHVDKLDVLVLHAFDACLESGQLRGIALVQVVLLPGGEPHGGSGSELGGRCPVGAARLGDVEQPRLPSFYGLCKGAVEPCDVRHFARHGPSALRLLAAYNLWLHAEGLQP